MRAFRAGPDLNPYEENQEQFKLRGPYHISVYFDIFPHSALLCAV